MILVDTSIWIDHIRKGDAELVRLLGEGQVLSHPFVVGEIAMGSIANRKIVLSSIEKLPAVTMARHDEVMTFVAKHSLFGLGIGYIDAHLLASAQLTPYGVIWTRDRRLQDIAAGLLLAYLPR